MKFHLINTSKQILLPLNIKKINSTAFTHSFIDHVVSNFSQDQKSAKIRPLNRYEMPKNKIVEKSDTNLTTALTDFQKRQPLF